MREMDSEKALYKFKKVFKIRLFLCEKGKEYYITKEDD
ncbi:hypothetical protein KR50_16470 [Jeotgalibacillus campisalis]|uniref:Uncharacterized protein n=1 Tax=Jeotgalibacillus campisalis TaxID=220754 RepID=A0A0C2RAY7_9BACL|nr:hypothetical protein KR50_16470 [Jeotgalibacillus campisalis]